MQNKNKDDLLKDFNVKTLKSELYEKVEFEQKYKNELNIDNNFSKSDIDKLVEISLNKLLPD